MNVPELTLAMLEIIKAGGFTTGGFNFDAKIRRQSLDPVDLVVAHAASMDAAAKALLNAAAIIEDGRLAKFVDDRYAGWKGAEAQAILAGKRSLEDLADYVAKNNVNPEPKSGKQEWLEAIVNLNT
jgi:xylose isomerase